MEKTIITQKEVLQSHQIGNLSYQVLGHSDNMTALHWYLPKGETLPEHAHPQEQMAYVISGSLEFTVNGEKHLLNGGDSILIASNHAHSLHVIEAAETIDVFSPVRAELPITPAALGL